MGRLQKETKRENAGGRGGIGVFYRAVGIEAGGVRVTRSVLGLWVLGVNWEVVRWYGARLGDGGDEPWGLAALVAALALTPRTVWRARMANTVVVGVGLLALAAVFSAGIVPMLVRAGLVAGALGVAIAGGAGAAGRMGLLGLSLPVVATAQFYAGYPLRAITAELGRPLLALAGVATERTGVVLAWSGGEVIVDAPCSGVRMLWMGLVVACGLAAWRRLRIGGTVTLVAVGMTGVIAANALRAAVLFLTESGVWPNAAWVHEAVGTAVFGGLTIGLWSIAGRGKVRCMQGSCVRRSDEAEEEPGRPVSKRVAVAVAVVGIFLAGWSMLRAAERGTQRAEVSARAGEQAGAFPGWPEFFEGRPLQPVARSEQTRVFARGFPGETAVFVQAERVLVLRWIREATRGVHPAADCYRARGYTVTEGGLVRDEAGGRWCEFVAERADERWRVRERWRDEAGGVWTDVSAWWWAAQGDQARGPWWAETVAVRR